MQPISTCLWFNDQGEEAVQFYTSLFEKSKFKRTALYGEAASKATGRPKGSVMSIEFELAGVPFMVLNGGPHIPFTQALSLSVSCNNEQEIDSLWKKLSQNGKIFFELQKYPWAEKYGWCSDIFGLSWQMMIGESPQKIVPSLLFMTPLYGKGKEAIDFYTSQFENSKIELMHTDPTSETVMHGSFLLDGQKFILMEGEKNEKHHVNESMSFVVHCESQKQIDQYSEKLTQGGGSLGQCGWLKDKFGISWQIVPSELAEMMSHSDAIKSDNVMKSILQMKNLDIAKLKQAFDGRKN